MSLRHIPARCVRTLVSPTPLAAVQTANSGPDGALQHHDDMVDPMSRDAGITRQLPRLLSNNPRKSQSLAKLFEGLHVEEVDFSPVLKMALEFFTHLGVAGEDRSNQLSDAQTLPLDSHESWWAEVWIEHCAFS